MKDKNGETITDEAKERARWAEHFQEILNRPPPQVPPDIPPAANQLAVSINPPTKAEDSKAIKSLKSGKAAGPDGIPPEALKADVQTSTEMIHPLLMKIWENEQIPVEWKKGYLVKLPKKGDLSSCNNWRGIMLLSIPSKILTRIILERIKKALDETLREEQAGFRQDRSCTDHIATLRIIIEQSLEWETPLYSVFVDFQKAFDSVDRDVIWRLMQHYGFPPLVHFHHTATVRQLQLPSHTRREVDGHIPGTDRCSSRLHTVADHLPSGSRLDYEAGNIR